MSAVDGLLLLAQQIREADEYVGGSDDALRDAPGLRQILDDYQQKALLENFESDKAH